MSITTWTSEGLNWDDMTGKVWTPYANAIRLAILERIAATGQSNPLVPEPYDAGDVTYGGWFWSIEGRIDDLMAQYVNHTASGDNLKPWTEQDMLDDIGDSERLHIVPSSLILGAWFKQQYEMINRLRWYYRDGWDSSIATREWKQADGYYGSWDNLVAAFNSLGWTYWSGNPPEHYGRASSFGYLMLRIRWLDMRCTAMPVPTDTVRSLHSHVAFRFANYPAPGWTYENNDYPVDEGEFHLIAENTTPNTDTQLTFDVGDLYGGNANLSEPVFNGDGVGWRLNQVRTVAKYDVAGGFKFIA